MTEEEYIAVSEYQHLGVALNSLSFVVSYNERIKEIVAELFLIRNDIYHNKLDNVIGG